MSKTAPMSFKISQYIKNNPNAKPAEVAKALGTTVSYVYVIVSKMKNGTKKKQTLTKAVIAKRMELAKAEAEKKLRRHPVTGKILMQGDGSYWDNHIELDKKENHETVYVTTSGQSILAGGPTEAELNGKDNVNHPAHYKVGGIETIDFIEAKSLGYNLGNVIKYVTRADHKGSLIEDLKKARWYLNREISKLDGAES